VAIEYSSASVKQALLIRARAYESKDDLTLALQDLERANKFDGQNAMIERLISKLQEKRVTNLSKRNTRSSGSCSDGSLEDKLLE
jgi:hypothetical protein